MAQLFNSKVNIITKTEIRYEGTLFQINPQQQTIALKDVRSFGTEGRRPDHEIPPNQQSYDIIVFKAGEIKEFKTQEEPKPEEPIQKIEEPKPQKTQFDQVNVNSITKNPREFNFDEMIEKSDQIEKIKKQENKPKYNQSTSFFDSLSTSTQKQEKVPQNQRNQNQIDTDTFGNFYKQRPYRNNNSYNNNNNNNNNQKYNHNQKYHNKKRNEYERVLYVEKETVQQQQQQQQ